ncbi:zinc finger protein 862-like [Saccostrea cucullata]|uniref:zinc finger protein 862-like n=1 Tax=Saccostrea cuccullata TaxID=36930 RepID=UPI002ED0947D
MSEKSAKPPQPASRVSVSIHFLCNRCTNIKAPKHNFITGSNNIRFSTVTDHEKSISHIHPSKVVASRVEAAKKTSVAHKTVISLNEAARKQIELKFRNIHALVKNNRPISDFTWLNELDIAKGVDQGTTYNNPTAATAFLECISAVERERMNDLLTGIKFFSLTMDGSIDNAVVEQETLFFRAAKNGKIISRFVCIGEPNSISSADLYKFVKDSTQENGLEKHMSKLVGFGSDGAASMMGKKTGLVTLMKHDHPEMIGIHCLAHRLELAFKDIFKGDKLYMQLTTLLLGIYYFYKNSPKQRKCLKRSMEILDVKGTLPHRVCGSRWLPHMKKALGTLFKTHLAFFTQLQNASNGNAKAEGLFRMLESYNILLYAAPLQEIIGPLTRLSLTLQKTDITLGDAKDMICATKELLLQTDTSDCTKIQSIVKDKEWIGHPLKVRGSELKFQNKCNTIVSALIKLIDLRYKDLNDDVLESTLIGSFRNWPCEMKSGMFYLCFITMNFNKHIVYLYMIN